MRYGLILLIFLLTDCQREPRHTPVYDVPAEVQPFIDQFRQEAQQRGQAVELNDLIVRFGQPQSRSTDVCGECLRRPGQTPIITIVADGFCWQSAYREVQEALVFHELGHCVLGRGHRTDRLPNGDYASLMSGQDVMVYSRCVYAINGDANCDRRARRPYYVAELFDPKTPVPAWAK